jgi:hypothetical protein
LAIFTCRRVVNTYHSSISTALNLSFIIWPTRRLTPIVIVSRLYPALKTPTRVTLASAAQIQVCVIKSETRAHRTEFTLAEGIYPPPNFFLIFLSMIINTPDHHISQDIDIISPHHSYIISMHKHDPSQSIPSMHNNTPLAPTKNHTYSRCQNDCNNHACVYIPSQSKNNAT